MARGNRPRIGGDCHGKQGEMPSREGGQEAWAENRARASTRTVEAQAPAQEVLAPR